MKQPWRSVDLGHRLAAVGLAATLLGGMLFSTFPSYAFGVLAPLLLEEFAIGAAGLGAIVSLMNVSAAGSAKALGSWLDRAGGRVGLVVLFGTSCLAMAILAVSGSIFMLVIVALVAGVGMGVNNPVTNRLVAFHAAPGHRGLLMGVKQTGVKVAQLLAGSLLPLLALTLGWRAGVGLVAVAGMLVLAVGLPLIRPSNPSSWRRTDRQDVRLSVSVRWLQAYAGSMAMGQSALATYLALYAVEAVGMSLTAAGLVVSTLAVTAVVARLTWATLAERFSSPPVSLMILSAGGVIGLVTLSLAAIGGPALIWVGAVGTGITAGSWNVVVQLSIVTEVRPTESAAASGSVQWAFLLGLALGAPAFGLIVDLTGSFLPAWSVATALTGVAFCFALFEFLKRRHRDPIRLEEGLADG